MFWYICEAGNNQTKVSFIEIILILDIYVNQNSSSGLLMKEQGYITLNEIRKHATCQLIKNLYSPTYHFIKEL